MFDNDFIMNGGSQLGGMRINRLLLNETGTHNNQFSRPFSLDISNENAVAIEAVIDNARGSNGELGLISSMDLASNAPGVIRPNSMAGDDIQIPNGWGVSRFLYILEAETTINGTVVIFYIQGYTEFADPSRSGLIDPKMVFFINTITKVSRSFLPGGGVRDIIIDNNAILFDPNMVSNGLNDMYSNPDNIKMAIRPNDVYSGIESSYISNTISDNYSSGHNQTIDTRPRITDSPKSSNRENNIGSNYVCNIINAQTTAKNITDIGTSSEDLFNKAKSNTGESNLATNSFLRAISTNKNHVVSSTFTFEDLLDLDQNAHNVTNCILNNGPAITKVHNTGSTEYWDGGSVETIIATICSNSIPALMSKYFIGKLSFNTTNITLDGSISVGVSEYKSILNLDSTAHLENFMQEFKLTTMSEITHGGLMQIELSIEADIYRDTWISVSVNGGPTVDYNSPTFCDSLSNPMITDNVQQFYSVVTDFDSLLGQVS